MSKDIMSVPEGTYDLLGYQCKVIKKLMEDINKIFYCFGYDEVITPTLEFYDTFNRYENGIKQEEMYKFFDNKGKILVLRADGTIPIARLVATKLRNSNFPLRLSYSSKIFRLNETLVGKKNEFLDCGVEFIGGKTFDSDIEVLVIAINALKQGKISEFKIEIGHIGIFNNLWNKSQLDNKYREKLSSLIENKKLVELDELLNKLNISGEYKAIFKALPWMFGGKEVFHKVREIIKDNDVLENICYLEKIYEGLKFLGYEDYVIFDLGATPKIDYYSGIIFKGYIKGLGSYVLYGGRYDNLIKEYGKDVKAIGLSININELSKAIDEKTFLDVDEERKIYYTNNNFLERIKRADELVQKGEKVLVLEEE
ncbi:MAG: ATP phosphoribosyltransferase regulatory subunit [Clostridium perfringens]|nr:ATP phosphoribosyltransferase regulatory subunit [Clostridium perfringens]